MAGRELTRSSTTKRRNIVSGERAEEEEDAAMTLSMKLLRGERKGSE